MENVNNMKAIDEEDLKNVSGGKENIGPDELWFEGTDVDKIPVRTTGPANGVIPIIFAEISDDK